MIVCTYWYDSMAAYDGNGGSFDLRLDATEGEAYAVSVELPATQVRQSGILYRTNPGTAVHLTFYYPAAAGGADVFEPLLGGPLGDWTPTPSGHKPCTHREVGAPATFELHPGRSFHRKLAATWVAPATGTVLLRAALNCDVPFFADVDADGCCLTGRSEDNWHDGTVDFSATGFICTNGAPTDSNNWLGEKNRNAICSAELLLTITPGAYYEGEDDAYSNQELVVGPAARTGTIELAGSELEALAAEMFAQSIGPEADLTAAPLLDAILVPESAAQAVLAAAFTRQQFTHLVFPSLIEGFAGAEGGRRVLVEGSSVTNTEAAREEYTVDATATRVSLEARAPTEAEAEAALDIIAPPESGRRQLQTGPAPSMKACDVVRTRDVDISKAEIEAMVANVFSSGGNKGRRHLQSSGPQSQGEAVLCARPTLEQMLVPGSPQQACLSRIFVGEQKPHRTSLLAIEQLNGDGTGRRQLDTESVNKGHRNLQNSSPQSQVELARRFRLTLKAEAPTPQEADAALADLIRARGASAAADGKIGQNSGTVGGGTEPSKPPPKSKSPQSSHVDPGCLFKNDGNCDEPIYCQVGSDSADCGQPKPNVPSKPPAVLVPAPAPALKTHGPCLACNSRGCESSGATCNMQNFRVGDSVFDDCAYCTVGWTERGTHCESGHAYLDRDECLQNCDCATWAPLPPPPTMPPAPAPAPAPAVAPTSSPVSVARHPRCADAVTLGAGVGATCGQLLVDQSSAYYAVILVGGGCDMPLSDLLSNVGDQPLRSPGYCPATCGEGPYFCKDENSCVASKAVCESSARGH
jgi:hypothetical protein